ncbi:efflux RND transporter periplasmic adaptor subunit [Paraferrimonas sedimenticola]|uniref:RND transporter MFP subunit n=1 Tax=Paraferrimonas sedimenticola TaxID=375674 RepID=A0AA37W075_9GAMM|nr:efflux RND transporter periplasmic adaptor subunit [Paraferrimonas sedimenticola]GLP98111.1 RND transporter MFP subunit [Paraferrimonas sedimenticola]
MRRLFLLAVFGLAACSEPAVELETPAATVESWLLDGQNEYLVSRDFSGNVRARNTSQVAFELPGKLASLSVDVGDKVSAGQVIARLDDQLLRAETAELKAQVVQTQAELDLNQATLSRNQNLKEQGYQSAQVMDELRAQRSSLEANLQRLEAALKANQLRIEKSSLHAPFDGVVTARHADIAQGVMPSTPIVTLIQPDGIEAIIGVPSELASELSVGQEVEVRVAGQALQAQVQGISQQLNQVSRTRNVRLSLPQGPVYVNGQLAQLSLVESVDQAGFWVPADALINGLRGLWNVYVIDQGDSELTVQRRDVEILYADEQRAFIRGAISENERIVKNGLHRLVSGQKVKLKAE